MMGISQLYTNSYWNTLNTSSVTNNVNSKNSQQNALDYAFQSVQTFPSFSWQAYQKEQDQYRSSISTFTSAVQGLNGSAKSLLSNATSNQRSVSASTGTAVTGVAKAGAKLAQYSVSVDQVATNQTNEGKSLSPSGYGAVSGGISTFGIKVGNNQEKQISVNILSTDTNSQILRKYASAINMSGANVLGEIKTNKNGQYLSVSSKEIGATSNFTIRDITGSGVAKLQLDNKVVSAADAKYSINGTNYQTATNKVTLDNGNVSLNINATTTGTIKVNVGKDESKIVTLAQKLADSYNRLHDVLTNSDYNITKLGATALSGVESLVSKTWSADFASIGISLDKGTGHLQVDQKKLSAALISDPTKVDRLLTGTASLGKAVERAGKTIGNTPVSSYVKVPNPLDSLDYSSKYSTTGWTFSQNNLSQGLFLNMMV